MIACFGDSLVYGFPYGEKYSWLSTAEKLSNIKLLNYGVCGETTDDIASRLSFTILSERISAVLFFGGANDVIAHTPIKVTLGAIKKAISKIKSINCKAILVLPLLSSESEFNEKLLALRKEYALLADGDVLLLDFMPCLEEIGLENAYLDGFHPKATTYEAMGIIAGEFLQKNKDLLTGKRIKFV